MEREKRGDIIDGISPLQHLLNISNPRKKGIGNPLGGCGSTFTDMGARNTHGIKFGNVLDAVFNGVSDESNGGRRRKDISSSSNILLNDIVLDRSS
jgi:hypothetical protein